LQTSNAATLAPTNLPRLMRVKLAKLYRSFGMRDRSKILNAQSFENRPNFLTVPSSLFYDYLATETTGPL